MKILDSKQFLESLPPDYFQNASVFGAIPMEAIHWLLQRGTIYSWEEGDALFEKDAPGNSFHVILTGQISYYKYHGNRYAYIRDYKVGEQIGFMSLIALHDRVGRAEAKQATTTLEVDSKLFHAFHIEKPLEFGILVMNLAREMARSLRDVDNLLVEKSREK